MSRVLALALFMGVVQATPAFAQRFGGQFGGAAGFWLTYVAVDVRTDRSLGRDLGGVITLGARAFFQTGRVRLGGGGFGGSFTDEGPNAAGNPVSGSLSAGGFTAEYLVLQRDVEIALGGLAGGGVLTIEEQVSRTGDVEQINRRRDTIFVGFPWVRLGWNAAPFVNIGLHLGYMYGSEDVGGFTVGIDVLAGLIP